MTFPVFASGDVLNASDMNAVGLWLVKTQTIGTTVSSVTVTNCFSADYDAYKITVTGGLSSSGDMLTLQLGSTTTGYYWGRISTGFTSGTTGNGNGNNTAAFQQLSGTSGTVLMLTVDLLNPFLNKETAISGPFNYPVTGSGGGAYAGFLNNTTSYTGFTLGIATGTMTGGTIRIYGYRN